MKAILSATLHCGFGALLALLSTFVGERTALALYPDIMGCESGCVVVAAGWPLAFVRDYLGMSVVNTANIMEVWFAADQFTWKPFLIDMIVWSFASFVMHTVLRRLYIREP